MILLLIGDINKYRDHIEVCKQSRSLMGGQLWIKWSEAFEMSETIFVHKFFYQPAVVLLIRVMTHKQLMDSVYYE